MARPCRRHPLARLPIVPRLIDITRPLNAQTPPWPGDNSVVFQPQLKISAGESVNLGFLSLSLHNGTHADAPYHYDDNGPTIDALSLDRYVGPAHVIDVRGHHRIDVPLLASLGAPLAPRLLIQTGAWVDAQQFPTNWPLMTEDVPAWLARKGVVLVGLDAPSVDAIDSKDLPGHRACRQSDILILENLLLDQVASGQYELIALPLAISGADGSPVRAVLRQD